MAEANPAVHKTNWDKCCICQQDTKEKLIQPSLFNREQDRAGYGNIARNVPLFYEINALPILLNPTRLDDGNGMGSTLMRNRAKYHQAVNCCSTIRSAIFNLKKPGASSCSRPTFARPHRIKQKLCT